MAEVCRSDDGNPGLRARPPVRRRLAARAATRSASPTTDGGFGLWAEQLIAESTGKHGKGLVPAPGESPDGPDRQCARPADRRSVLARRRVLPLGVRRRRRRRRSSRSTRSTSPTCRRRRTRRTRCSRPARSPTSSREGSIDELLAQANERDYVCVQAFIEPSERERPPHRRPRPQAAPPQRARRHPRLRPALPPLDRAAAQGRPEHRPLPAGRRRSRRGARRSPASRSASAA